MEIIDLIVLLIGIILAVIINAIIIGTIIYYIIKLVKMVWSSIDINE